MTALGITPEEMGYAGLSGDALRQEIAQRNKEIADRMWGVKPGSRPAPRVIGADQRGATIYDRPLEVPRLPIRPCPRKGRTIYLIPLNLPALPVYVIGERPIAVIERKISVRDCIVAVSEATGVPINEILSPRREQRIVRPRQISAWVAKQVTSASFPEIGRRLDGRDHTTVLHACRRVEAALLEAGIEPSGLHDLEECVVAGCNAMGIAGGSP